MPCFPSQYCGRVRGSGHAFVGACVCRNQGRGDEERCVTCRGGLFVTEYDDTLKYYAVCSRARLLGSADGRIVEGFEIWTWTWVL